MQIPFYLHNLGEAEIESITAVLRTPFLTTGKVTAEFEEKFSAYLGIKHTIGVTSCTAGMFLILKALGIGPGDEVITTPLSFIATANSIVHVGAKPVFVDIEPETGNIDAAQIEAAITAKTRAILPVHLYGHLVDMHKIKSLAEQYNLKVIEDAAHCIEAERDGYRVGQLGDAASFSFYATKNITCGEGGAVAIHDAQLNDRIRVLRLHGMSQSAIDRYTAPRYQHYDVEMVGYKFNMPNLEASLLIPQLPHLDTRRDQREAICQQYEAAFKDVPGLSYPQILPHNTSARHLFTIWVNPAKRDEIMWQIQAQGIGVAVNFRPIHLMSYYRETFGFKPGDFPIAEHIGASTITLPMYPKLKPEEVDYIIETVKQIVGKHPHA